MSNFDIMPAIPTVNMPINSSPHRPTPKFFHEAKTFSTKKERGSTPRSNYYPRPPIKSCPPISRVFQHVSTSDRPRVISFKQSNDTSLSASYDSEKRDLYFQQCFNIEKKLGAGSFGDVYQVRSKEDGHQYAVKRSRERFKGELDRRRKLEEVSKHELLPAHPNCVRFYKAWEERQHLYIQTELCNTSLANLAESEHEIPEKIIWNYLIDLLMAVKHLHDNDLIHMDIKPENIFIAKDGTCQLGDFGLILDLSKQSDLSEAQEGDPKYLAPELMQGKFTKAADVFSLGITILELATDLDLPRGDAGWHQLRQGTLPADIVKDRLSPDLESVVMLMMDPDFAQRASAAALLEIPVIKRRHRYNIVSKFISTKKESLSSATLALWCYFVQLFCLTWNLITGVPAEDTTDSYHHRHDSSMSHSFDHRPNSSLSSSTAGHINSSWDSSHTDESVFGEDSISMMAQTLDFSSDSNDSSELILPAAPSAPKALTTGARRRPVRTARLYGGVDSPVKTPSQGSPMLVMSSRSSQRSVIPQKGPSSTTPPSCRKLFEDPDELPTQIGPKNLMSAFDTAESDDEKL